MRPIPHTDSLRDGTLTRRGPKGRRIAHARDPIDCTEASA
jgi:hypothetical protein